MNKTERLVILAIKAGYTVPDEIQKETALYLKTIYQVCESLRAQYEVTDNYSLYDALKPARPEQVKFISHNCVIVDRSLDPTIVASLFRQILGPDYCTKLKSQL